MQLAALSLFYTLFYTVHAHGYLSSPPPRGIQHVATQIDQLRNPNTRGVCRGEPEGTVTTVTPGQPLTLVITASAPHTGPCEVTLLDFPSLANPIKIASKYDCAAPHKVAPWTIQLPADVYGRKVLRWYWEGRHISNPGEPYEQCVDLLFGTPNSVLERKPLPADLPEPDPHVPVQEYAPPPTTTPAPQGDTCTNGRYECRGTSAQYGICNNGAWVTLECGVGTTCQSFGDGIVKCI
jgi:hypothetical protein